MTGGERAQADETTTARLKRRGLIAGAAALVAGVVVQQTSSPVAAADGNGITIGVGGNASNIGSTTTTLNTVATGSPGFRVTESGNGSFYNGITDAIADGIQGYTNIPNAAGVFGRNDIGNGIGSAGVASSGIGVYGQTDGGSALTASATSGFGIYAQSGSGIGVYSSSANSYGVVGTSGGAGYYGIYGITTANSGAAFAGGTNNPNAFAAVFGGTVVVNGTFMVSGTKSAAVPNADGSHRLVYCMESPESWFEDFGEAKLIGGKADVKIEAGFADTIHTDQYHVFVTPYGNSAGLFVTNRSATGFSVREQNNGASNLTFSYRIVAKRKDVAAERLAKVNLPQVKIVNPAVDLPKPNIPTRQRQP